MVNEHLYFGACWWEPRWWMPAFLLNLEIYSGTLGFVVTPILVFNRVTKMLGIDVKGGGGGERERWGPSYLW